MLAMKIFASQIITLPCVAALGPDVTRARVLVHEAARAEEIERRLRVKNVYHAGLEVNEHRAGGVLAALGLV
jgi:hypothetical protein